MKAAQLWRFWLPPFLYLALIFVLSSLSQPPIPPGISGDSLHFPEYAILGFLLARAFHSALGFQKPALSAFLALACSVLWGATDEFHQAFVPGRVPDLGDLAHDAIGATVGMCGWLAWLWWRRRADRRRPAS
jgi:VanZ family protein